MVEAANAAESSTTVATLATHEMARGIGGNRAFEDALPGVDRACTSDGATTCGDDLERVKGRGRDGERRCVQSVGRDRRREGCAWMVRWQALSAS
jgi:hypothetical protein